MNNKLRVVVWASSLLVAAIVIVVTVFHASKEEDLSGGFMQALYDQMVHDARLEQERRNADIDRAAIEETKRINAPRAKPASENDGFIEATIISMIHLPADEPNRKEECTVTFLSGEQRFYALGCKWLPLFERYKLTDPVRIKPSNRPGIRKIVERVEPANAVHNTQAKRATLALRLVPTLHSARIGVELNLRSRTAAVVPDGEGSKHVDS